MAAKVGAAARPSQPAAPGAAAWRVPGFVWGGDHRAT